MASSAVISAVQARLSYNSTTGLGSWTANDGTVMPVLFPNTDGPTPVPPFLEVQFPVATERHVGMAGVGNRTFREDGGFRLVMTVVRGGGQSLPVGWMDELRILFRAQQFGGVTTFAPSPPTDNDDNDVGAYWLLSFSVPYFYDLLA